MTHMDVGNAAYCPEQSLPSVADATKDGGVRIETGSEIEGSPNAGMVEQETETLPTLERPTRITSTQLTHIPLA
ncbi:hypothetical protein C8D91_2669 [Marinicella litoralis]|uniref:Uncharacterized protein n=1 Tax=Marinicella litoralis TaxID=644220 RepID=A0A4R6XHZ7_9GAMM|nr:hypothetical protein C8D91_2669 [Marinicella litoralis]